MIVKPAISVDAKLMASFTIICEVLKSMSEFGLQGNLTGKPKVKFAYNYAGNIARTFSGHIKACYKPASADIIRDRFTTEDAKDVMEILNELLEHPDRSKVLEFVKNTK